MGTSPPSFSLIYTHRNIHISPKVNSPGSNFIEPCKQNCIFSLSSWTDAESAVYYREYSPFLSLSHSEAKEKAILLSIVLPIRWHQWDLAWFLVAPPGQKPRGQFDSLRCCFSEGQMFFKIHSPSQMEPKFPFHRALTVGGKPKTEPSLNSSLRI